MKTLLTVIILIIGLGLVSVLIGGEETTEIKKEENSEIVLAQKTVVLDDGTEQVFNLPEEFNISVASEELGKPRFMAISSDGRLFVPDLVNMNLSHDGRLIILDEFNEESKKFHSKEIYLSGLRGPNSVAFYTDDKGQEWLYLALTEHLIRYPYQAGDTEPSAEPEIIFSFDNEQTPGADNSVWHITRTILFEGETLFIGAGSGCNSCEQPSDERRAMILKMTAEGENVEIYADGIRNAVGLAYAGDALYSTENGADHLGEGVPNDLVYKVKEGEHYGWPYCYELDGEKLPDTTREWNKDFNCTNAPLSLSAFPAHSAPLGITYFDNAHSVLEDFFLVALHGSFRPNIGNGYEVARVSKDGERETFMDGFLTEAGERVARPVHILQKDENSFFLTDDFGGRIYYIYNDNT